MLRFGGKAPQVHGDAFIAPGARLIGDVQIGAEASIWYGCVLRGDVNHISIGPRSNVQDGSIIHVDSPKPGREEGHPTLIGAEVLIGHMAMVHGCIIGDRAFVGLGAIVMDGCEMEAEAMLAAGAMLTPGRRIPARQLWAGRPARYMRDLTDAELFAHREGIEHYVALGRAHKAALKAC